MEAGVSDHVWTLEEIADLAKWCAMRKSAVRALIEVGFIVFLFYSNLLMGEFERSGMGLRKGLAWAVRDIFTLQNFAIAITAAVIGHTLFDLLRNRLWNRNNSN
jgi:hypothetical protein